MSVSLASVKESIPHLLLSNRAGMTDPYDLRFRVLNTHKAYDSKVDPSKPDTDKDGNGYLGGWSGVYNVSYDHDRGIPYADNVVLYREHLQSGGISGDKTVSKQADVHHTDEVASAVGADIDRVDDNKEHSTIHIGELQWGSDPDGGENIPDTGISIEVDFTAGVQQSFNSSSWEIGRAHV